MNAALPRPPRPSLLATFGRHQVGSIIATGIDFATMSALVSGAGMSAALATAIGAAVGGLSNFLLGRHWIFAAKHDHVGGQAGRYVFVSGASLCLNATGEYVLHDLLGIQYLLARVIIASVVSVCWNFPVQRAFVYRQAAAHGHGSPTPGPTP